MWGDASDGMLDEPYITPDRWNAELVSAGFKPLDTRILDGKHPFQTNAIMIASPVTTELQTKHLTLLCRSHDSDPLQLRESLSARGFTVSRCNLGESLPAGQDIIALLDEAGPFFHHIAEDTWQQFQAMIGSLGESRMIWLTRPCQMDCEDPRYGQVIGVARTIRSEMLLNFATCETRDIEKDSELIVDIFSHFQRPNKDDNLGPDFEFLVRNGTVDVGRFYPFSLSDQLLTSDAGKEFELTLTRTGRVGTLQWSPKPISILCGDEVDVETHAVGLNFVVR